MEGRNDNEGIPLTVSIKSFQCSGVEDVLAFNRRVPHFRAWVLVELNEAKPHGVK